MKVLVIVGLVLIIGIAIFVFSNSKKNTSSVVYRLSWFELQVCPDISRLAAIPNQPILLYKEPASANEKGAVLLLRREINPQLFDKVYEDIDKLIQNAGLPSFPQKESSKCFSDEGIKTKSIHLRFRYADGVQWASVYPIDSIPQEVLAFIDSCRALTNQVFAEANGKTIPGDEALKHVEEAPKSQDDYRSDIVCKIKVTNEGKLFLNSKMINQNELPNALDDLKNMNGAVWYYREQGDKEPSNEVDLIIKYVLDEVVKRKLPVKLSETDFE